MTRDQAIDKYGAIRYSVEFERDSTAPRLLAADDVDAMIKAGLLTVEPSTAVDVITQYLQDSNLSLCAHDQSQRDLAQGIVRHLFERRYRIVDARA